MAAPAHRYGPRGSQFVRQWTLLVLLRRAAFTLDGLAAELNCHKRTVMRDLAILEAVGFPLIFDRSGPHDPATWSLPPIPEWPRNAISPEKPLQESAPRW
jgi:hypothetical protein